MAPGTDLEQRQMEMFADLELAAGLPAGSVRINGLMLTEELDYDTWVDLGRRFGAVRRWANFGLGDWYLYGEAVFGEEASQATEATAADRIDVLTRVTGLSPATLQNYASICHRVPIERRRVELDFSHHEAVASLEPGEQETWLERAIDEGWGRKELREAIRDAKRPAPAGDDDPPPDPGRGDGDGLTLNERLEQAARRCWHQAQRTGDGSAVVPPEPWAMLTAALGEE